MSHAAARILDFPDDFLPESELPTSDDVPLDSPRQRKQINLALDVIGQAMAEQGEDDYYAGGNEFVYYSNEQARAIRREVDEQLVLFPGSADGRVPKAPPGQKPYKGPDVFVVRGGVKQREREMWVSWLEDDRLPDFIFEIQSPSTADIDAGAKRRFYADVFKCREYFYYGPDDPELGKYQDKLVGLRLDARGVYAPIDRNAQGRMWSEVLGAWVGRWAGVYDSRKDRWIRLYDAQGRLIPTGKEEERRQKQAAEQRAEAERRQKEEERRQKEAAEQRAEAERRHKEEERRQKEEERRQKQAAEQRAEAERRQKEAAEQRAEAAEAEIVRLRELLKRGGSQP